MFSDEERDRAHKRAEAAYIGVSAWDDAVRADCDAAGVTANLHRVADVMLGLTAELLAARGGTMTAEQVAHLRHEFDLGNKSIWEKAPENTENMLDHFSAQGARVAVLEEENSLRQNIIDAEARKMSAAQQHISDLEKSLENARKEREEAVRTGKQFHADSRKHFDQSCTNLQRAETAERERDEAVADNAAKHKAFEEYVTMYGVQHGDIPGTETTCPEDDTCECAHVAALNAAFGPGHPGSAMLERLKRMEEVVREARNLGDSAAWAIIPKTLLDRMDALVGPNCTDASCPRCRSGAPCH